jgi:hypothetical protein
MEVRMRLPLSVALVLLAAACGGSEGFGPEDVLDLVPEAAAVPEATFRHIREAGASFSPQSLKDVPLSLLLTMVQFQDSQDLRRLSSETPAELGRMWRPVPGNRRTLLTEGRLSEIDARAEADRAVGSFRFRLEGIAEGRVEFSAEKAEDGWRIVEFRLPGANVRTSLRPDGTWEAK